MLPVGFHHILLFEITNMYLLLVPQNISYAVAELERPQCYGSVQFPFLSWVHKLI
jgi:hypothetical protein